MLESITMLSLLLLALDRLNLQQVFDNDPYESRRTAMPGSRLVKLLVVFQMIKSTRLRGLVRAVEEHPQLQASLGREVARNTLSNALRERDLEQMISAWMLILHTYSPWIARMGKKFARIAIVDSSLIKLSLQAFAWAEYRKKSGAAKMTVCMDWVRGIPQQLIFTVGKPHDLKCATQLKWVKHWTYVFDRGYFCFKFLASVLEAGAHFVVRFKKGVNYRVVERRPVEVAPESAQIRLTSDWTIRLIGWSGVMLRLVSYQLPDGRMIRVLTDRFDLTALSVAQLYKERWKIENWWKWAKAIFKIKEALGRSEKALELQIVGAFVTDLLLRAFKASSGFTGSHYEFVTRCQEMSLVAIGELSEKSELRRAMEAILKLFTDNERHLELVA